MLHPETAQRLRDRLSDMQMAVLEDVELPYTAKETIVLSISRHVFQLIDKLEGVIR